MNKISLACNFVNPKSLLPCKDKLKYLVMKCNVLHYYHFINYNIIMIVSLVNTYLSSFLFSKDYLFILYVLLILIFCLLLKYLYNIFLLFKKVNTYPFKRNLIYSSLCVTFLFLSCAINYKMSLEESLLFFHF